MASKVRYYLIAFIILFSSLFFRYFLTGGSQPIDFYAELKPNELIKITGYVQAGIDLEELYLAGFRIKNEGKTQYIIGQRLQVIGKPQVRVINGLYRQIWLINPEITVLDFIDNKQLVGQNICYYTIWTSIGKLLNFLVLFRNHCLAIFYQVLPYQQAGLLSGIVLGASSQFNSDTWEAMQKTGTLHIVAASGVNVMLVSKVLLDLLIKFIKRKSAYFVTIVFIFIYFVLAGGSPAVGRASILASVSFLGLFWGRNTSSGWLLILTGWLMLLINPWLLFDTGFQLSFTAMAGMIFLKPLGSDLIHSKSSLIIIILDTISAQIATFPVIYFTFGQVQFWSFLPNLMVVPTVPVLMMLGFSILLLGLIYLPLAYPLAWLSWPVLTYFLEVIKYWGKIL